MDRVIGGVHVESGGWKSDVGVAAAVLAGVCCLIVGSQVHGWLRLGLQLLGGLLALPLVAVVCLMVVGGAISGLAEPEPSFVERGALAAVAIGLGAWFGSYVPSAPQDLVVTSVGLVGSVYLLRQRSSPSAGPRRRIAGCVVLFAAAAGRTGVWLLARA